MNVKQPRTGVPSPGATVAPAGMRRRRGVGPASVAHVLVDAAVRGAGRLTHLGRRRQTHDYADLLRVAERMVSGLRTYGVRAGDPLVLQLSDTDQFLSALWACLLGGIVAVPMPASAPDGGASADELRATCELVGRPSILASDRMVGRFRRNAETWFKPGQTVVSWEAVSHADASGLPEPPRDDALAVLQLTSGSTGMRKCVPLTHRNLLAVIEGTADLPMFSGPVSVSWMPLDHAGTIVWHLRDTYLGHTQILARPEDFAAAPLAWLDWLDEFRATATRAPNFAFALIVKTLGKGAPKTWDLSSMQAFVNAGEPIQADTCRRFLDLLQRHGLDRNTMFPCYGLAETSSGVTYATEACGPPSGTHVVDRSCLDVAAKVTRVPPHHERALSLVEVGSPIPGVMVRVVDGDDRPLPEFTVGNVQIKGATVTGGYLAADGELDRSCFAEGQWFKTGDIGFMCQGSLTLCGRRKDVVIVRGRNVFAHAIEAAIRDVPDVDPTRVAVCRVYDARAETESVSVVVASDASGPVDEADLATRVRRAVVARFAFVPVSVDVLPSHEFPRTSMGKLRRSALERRLAARRRTAARPAASRHPPRTERPTTRSSWRS